MKKSTIPVALAKVNTIISLAERLIEKFQKQPDSSVKLSAFEVELLCQHSPYSAINNGGITENGIEWFTTTILNRNMTEFAVIVVTEVATKDAVAQLATPSSMKPFIEYEEISPENVIGKTTIVPCTHCDGTGTVKGASDDFQIPCIVCEAKGWFRVN